MDSGFRRNDAGVENLDPCGRNLQVSAPLVLPLRETSLLPVGFDPTNMRARRNDGEHGAHL